MMNSPDKKTATQSELLRQMYAGSIVPIVTSMVLATILAYIQKDVIGIKVVVAWLFFIASISLLRVALSVAYRRHSLDRDTANNPWLLGFRLGRAYGNLKNN